MARSLGCSGAHQSGDGWMPCRSHEHLRTLIRRGSAGYREWLAERGEDPEKKAIVEKPELPARFVGRVFTSEEDARNAAEELGCDGVRTFTVDGKTYYRPCKRLRKPRKRWENLRERGVVGIATGPEGGLSSAPVM